MPHSVKINGEFPVGNAAGWCKSVEEVRKLAFSAAQFIVVGSITVAERAGNPGNTFNGVSLNSLGLPNPGLEKISAVAKEMIDLAHAAEKPIILSAAGFNSSEYSLLASKAKNLGFDGVEINFGCPNVADDGKRKPIFSFHLGLMTEALDSIYDGLKGCSDFFVSVKVSPMSNPLQIFDTAELLSSFAVDAVVTQNTFPNALLYNANGTNQIDTPDKTGWAGLAGSDIKAMTLGQVSQWGKALDSFGAQTIGVWGVGGVQTARDVHDMELAGAAVVQVGTAYFVGGPKVFSEIAAKY